MNDKDEKNNLVVLHSPHQHNLMKVNRWLTYTVFFLMSVIVVLGLWLLPSHTVNSYQPVSTKAYMEETNPVLSAEVNALKGQFVGLMSGTIESKLKVLEENVRLGAAPDALMTIEELRNDIKNLRTYSEPATKTVANEQLMQEMSSLKRLVYWTLSSCGLMFVAVAGLWFKNRRRLPYKDVITRLHKD